MKFYTNLNHPVLNYNYKLKLLIISKKVLYYHDIQWVFSVDFDNRNIFVSIYF